MGFQASASVLHQGQMSEVAAARLQQAVVHIWCTMDVLVAHDSIPSFRGRMTVQESDEDSMSIL